MQLYVSEAIRVCIASFIIRDCSSFWGRTSMDRPICAASITGLLLGDVKTGLQVAAAVEGMFVGVAHVGTMVTDYTLAAIFVSAMTIINKGGNTDAYLALAVPVASLGVAFMNITRPLFSLWYPVLTKYAEVGDWRGVKNVRWIKAVIGWLPNQILIFLAVAFGTSTINFILEGMPDLLNRTCSAAGGLMIGFGIALCLNQLWDNKYCAWFFFGWVLTKYAGLATIAVLVISIAIGIAYAQLLDTSNKSVGTVSEEEELFA